MDKNERSYGYGSIGYDEADALVSERYSGDGSSNATVIRVLSAIVALIVAVSAFFIGMLFGSNSGSYESSVTSWIYDTVRDNSIYYDKLTDEQIEDIIKYGSTYGLRYGIGVGNKTEENAEFVWENYSGVYTPEETLALLASFAGSETGIGVSIGTICSDDYNFLLTGEKDKNYYVDVNGGEKTIKYVMNTEIPVFLNVTGGSNAADAGFLAYDRPVSLGYEIEGEVGANTVNVEFYGNDDKEFRLALSKVPEGTSFTLTVERPVWSDEKKCYVYDADQAGGVYSAHLERASYEPDYCSYYDHESADVGFASSLDEDTAVIRLTSFDANSDKNFAREMNTFKNKGKKKLILDLRNNGGGMLDCVSSIASYLVSNGNGSARMAVEVDKNGKAFAITASGNKYGDMGFEKVVLLVNGYSASATELLTMAMKDYGTADAIFGTQTFGKGIVQRYFSHSSGFILKLTVAQYYSAVNGDFSPQGIGIAPYVKGETVGEGEKSRAYITDEKGSKGLIYLYGDYKRDTALNEAIAFISE